MYRLILILSFMIMNFSLTIAQFYGGDGSVDNPYQVTTPAELNNVRNFIGTSNLGKYFILINDIDLSDYLSTGGGGYVMWGSAGWLPIGLSGTEERFYGQFNGNNKKITGLSIDRKTTDRIGLFGYTGDGAKIENLGLEQATIFGRYYVGIAVGTNYNSTVSNCYGVGTISGEARIGGLVGLNNGSSATVSNCYASVSVEGITQYNQYNGGLVGENASNAIISNCYANGPVSGLSRVAGLVGGNSGTIQNSYATGTVTGSGSYIGGFVGHSYTLVSNSFWDVETDGISGNVAGDLNYGATGKTTVEMKTQTTFLVAGWSSTIWYMDGGINSGYPYLEWQNTGGSPLSVELTTFSASDSSDKIILYWQTATEVNNYGFEIERSQTEAYWSKVGFVDGSGNSNSPKEYTFSDQPIKEGHYFYRLKQIDNDGKFEYSKVVEVNYKLPILFSLEQNYPNPFNPSTIIKYSVPYRSNVSLKIFDLLGKQVAEVVNEEQTAGNYEIKFDASGLSSGLYFYRLTSGIVISTRKMILTK